MDCYADVASLVYPVDGSAYVAPFQPLKQRRNPLMERTEFVNEKKNLLDLFHVETGPLAPTVARTTSETSITGTTAQLRGR